MRISTTFIAASAMLATTTFAQAGGLSDEITEAPVVVVQEAPAAGSSISPTYIVLGVLAALLIAATIADDDDDDVTMGMSDVRLKQDITRIGTAANGLPLYSFRYIGHDQLFSGVMAQDVLQHTPEAIVTYPGGLMAVNYDLLGLKMERLN